MLLKHMISWNMTEFTEIISLSGCDKLQTLFVEFRNEINEISSDRVIKLGLNEFKNSIGQIDLKELIREPTVLLQITLLTNLIIVRLNERELSQREIILKSALQDCLSRQLDQVISASEHQLKKLCSFLNQIRSHILELNYSEVYILELPLGNSIPSIILKEMFEERGINVKILSSSVNRNDSKRKGITRTQIINQRLSEIKSDNSILVYIDEWISGTNFHNILNILNEHEKLKLVPCAFMLEESKSEKRFETYKTFHDDICRKINLTFDDLTCVVPELNSLISSHQKFIWAESDRLAGYRKMEYWGSIVSSFISAGELLYNEPETLNETLKKYISEYTDLDNGNQIPKDIREDINNAFKVFNDRFSDSLKREFESQEVNNFAEFDIVSETHKANSLIKSIEGYKESELAINIIGYYLKKNTISPTSRYFYKGQVPLCTPLDEENNLLHRVFVKKIKEFCTL